MNSHPCLNCGACCAYYRVSLHPSETLPESLEVPAEKVVFISSEVGVMKGTDTVVGTRCVALAGQIGRVGKGASCSIYENRPSACRLFEASYERGVKQPRCDEARAAHGLRPLTLRDYDGYRNRE